MDDNLHHQEHDREARIRECAYHLWEADGKPYGRDVEFWQRARQMVAQQDNGRPARAEPEHDAPPARAAPAARRRKAAVPRKAKTS